ncbi:MAG: PIG-L family deacetylase, partial [Oscillospiraceae bacterium]|nr:PIG-L family deacetylase [Oscillospiraceae bacterium]
TAHAHPGATPTPEPPASGVAYTLTDNLGGASRPVTDGSFLTRTNFRAGAVLHMASETPFSALYFYWNDTPAAFTVQLEDTSVSGGMQGFIHEYIRLPHPVNQADIVFNGFSPLCELEAYTDGSAPPGTQEWLPPCDKADVLVFPSHADDDVIFFGALMADCVDRGLDVQVCYLVDHAMEGGVVWESRNHELLNALYEMGIRHYPIIGPFPDYYILSLQEAKNMFGEDNVIAYQVAMLRRFRPSVVIGHDREGEYGHGAHRLNALCLEQAVPLAADPAAYPDTAASFGAWDTPKLYLHFAEENPLFLDVDTPLSHFGGRTAYEVAWAAMMYHETQLQYKHRPTKDTTEFEFRRYDCRRFGLVRSLVGEDTGLNDIMENIPQ